MYTDRPSTSPCATRRFTSTCPRSLAATRRFSRDSTWRSADLHSWTAGGLQIAGDPAGKRLALRALARIGDATPDGPPFVWPHGRLSGRLPVPFGRRLDIRDHLGRVADHHRARRDVAADHGTGADDRVVAHPRPGENDRSYAHEDTVADHDASDAGVSHVVLHARVMDHDDGSGRESRVLADGDEPRMAGI